MITATEAGQKACKEEKIALIQPGDFIEYSGLYSLERLGSASISTRPAGKHLILVLGKITRRVSIEPRRIQAMLRGENDCMLRGSLKRGDRIGQFIHYEQYHAL